MSNIITAHFATEQTRAWTDELWQYDYGQVLQFAGLDLPSAYEVHFANQPHGVDSITQIGTADGVTIPDQYLLSGDCVYAWVYLHSGEDDGETEYMVTIPVTKRAKPTNATPTPVQQDVITETIAALNTAVNEAETAIEHYPKIEDGTWRVWDVTNEEWVDTGIEAQGEDGYSPSASVRKSGNKATITITDQTGTSTAEVSDGEDGYSPELSAESITGGHRVSMTDASGTETFDVMDGLDGDDGYSPSASVSKDGHTTTISVTDKSGTTTAQVLDGMDGDDGYSPTASVSKSGDTATITITDKNGTTTATVSDGAQGDPGPGVPEGGQDGQVLRKQGNDDFSSYWDAEKVSDVQINGTTILDSDGVANIPKGSDGVLGAVSLDISYGVGANANGRLYVNKATEYQTKVGTEKYRPVAPYDQHSATFYGMAKAAGDSSQASSANAVGTYTSDAKSAISAMLNAPESVSGSTPSITAKSGIRYKCGECATLDIVVPASGLFEVDFESGSTATVLTTTGTTVTWPSWFDPTDLEADTLYEISIQDGRGLVATWPA